MFVLGRWLESAPFWAYVGIVVFPLSFLTLHYSLNKTNEREERLGAIAMDGWRSDATGSGAASHHGGVREWIVRTHVVDLSRRARILNAIQDYSLFIPLLVSVPFLLYERFVFRGRLNKKTNNAESGSRE